MAIRYTYACKRTAQLARNVTGDINEKQVTAAWQDLLGKGGRLQTESGDALQVIYPGKTSDLPGSDFQGAVIRVKRRTFRGNIELHVNASDWHKHEHDRNPAYNGVVLHVAWRRDCGDVIALQNGTVIPSVTLENYQPDETARLTTASTALHGNRFKFARKIKY